MGTQNEEISVKFGADTGPLDAGLRKMRSGLKEAGEHGHNSFVHVGSAARSFHKIMHEITAQSPIMGGALTLAISPVTGAFMAAGIIFEKVTEHVAKLNDELSKMGTEAAKPVSDVKENMREAKKSVQELSREFDKWLKGLEKDTTLEKLKMTIAEVGGKGKTASEAATAAGDPKAAAEIEKKSLQAQFQIQADALRKVSDKRLKTGDEIDTYERVQKMKEGQTRIRNAEQANRAEERIQAQAEEELKKIQDKYLKGPGWKDFWENGLVANEMFDRELDKERDAQNQTIKESKARIEKNKDVIDRENTQRKAVADKLEELKKKYADQKGIFDALSNELEDTRAKLAGIKGPADLRPQTVKDAEEGVNKLLKGNTDWQEKQQKAFDDWNLAHGIAPMGMSKDAAGVLHNAKETPLTLKDFKQWLEQQLTAAGIVVKAKD